MESAILREEWGEAWPTRTEIEALAEAVRTELSVGDDGRLARHSADIHYVAGRWAEAHQAYAEALEAGHPKVVHCHSRKAHCLIELAELAMIAENAQRDKKGKEFWRNTVKMAQNNVSHMISSPGQKHNEAVVELERAVEAAGGVDATAVPAAYVCHPGDDGTREFGLVLKMQATLLYRLKRVQLAKIACDRALDALPDDAELQDIKWEIGLRL